MSEEAGEQFVTMLIMIIITTRTTWNERTTWNTQKRLHPLEAKSKNQTQRMELKHRGVTNEIKLFSAISATRERWFVWHGNFILFEEPNPSGSRPSDLIGLEEQHMKPHPPNTQGRARRKHRGEEGNPEEAKSHPEEAERRRRKRTETAEERRTEGWLPGGGTAGAPLRRGQP